MFPYTNMRVCCERRRAAVFCLKRSGQMRGVVDFLRTETAHAGLLLARPGVRMMALVILAVGAVFLAAACHPRQPFDFPLPPPEPPVP